MRNDKWQIQSAFTLIELLVVISIIGILIGLSIFGLQGARTASRDAKRKADLEEIRSGLEIYKSDCNTYPVPANGTAGDPSSILANGSGSLVGDDSTSTCAKKNTYIYQIPADPIAPKQHYLYFSDGANYQLCAAFEQSSGRATVTCDTSSSCGDTALCNYKVVNP